MVNQVPNAVVASVLGVNQEASLVKASAAADPCLLDVPARGNATSPRQLGPLDVQ